MCALYRERVDAEGTQTEAGEQRAPRLEAIGRLLAIVDRLRDPGGCPWDREQTLTSMAGFAIEEAHELVEAIERGDDAACAEEAGDLLMVLAMICRIASEAERFDVAVAAEAVSEKLVRRHPHVFGELEVEGSREVLLNWERIKQEERREKRTDSSALAGVPLALPALQRADRCCAKAVSAGFRWKGAAGALAKLEEELDELRAEVAGVDLEASKPGLEPARRERIEAELGDVLLAGAFLGTYLGIDPERACRAAVRRFEQRFRRMEEQVGTKLSALDLERLVEAWREAKRSLG